jgi:pimeloyl-ACP methyl ester carboxylesterase
MIPAAPDGSVRLGGLALRDHWFDVPLDHSVPDGEQIRVFAREAVAVDRAGDDLPWLLFLQGGPGSQAPRPTDRSGWLGRAVQEFRVLLLDQRGTGLSTPVTPQSLQRCGEPAAQADYLARFRADAIVADAEWIRRRLLGVDRPWSVLGQSFGGFCILTYLSFAPDGLAAAYITGGLGPLDATAEDVYRATYQVVRRKNEAYHAAFPADREWLEAVAQHLHHHHVRLPDGSPLTVRRLQALGLALGGKLSYPMLHYLLEGAFAAAGELSPAFLKGVYDAVSFAGVPLFAIHQELLYAQGCAPRWAAHRLRPEEFDPDAAPLLFTGEMIYPWMFDDDPTLRPYRDVAHVLAERSDWPPLYDRAALGRNAVPAAAALYRDDMYVDARLSADTAAAVHGLRVWQTNAYEHDGLRESDHVFDRLVKMVRGEL